MIHVTPAAEPPDFEARVRVPGQRALAEMVGELPSGQRFGRRFKKIANRREDIPPDRFPSYWTEILDDLLERYGYICAYSCFRIHPVTGAGSVDHFAAKSRRWDQVYEWRNYRLACQALNARKRDFSDILDPFEVVDGWFQLELVGFQVMPAEGLADPIRYRVQDTIDRLRLNDFRRSRERDAEYYWDRQISWRVLCDESPFVARELQRQGRLHAEDARS